MNEIDLKEYDHKDLVLPECGESNLKYQRTDLLAPPGAEKICRCETNDCPYKQTIYEYDDEENACFYRHTLKQMLNTLDEFGLQKTKSEFIGSLEARAITLKEIEKTEEKLFQSRSKIFVAVAEEYNKREE
ncbi:MAG: hypothetical protein PHU51_05410 [Candidatus Nanoarchaeia archaeon]|nr:hypothetical protein [Candidatus Nanoarchaeia archaeon]